MESPTAPLIDAEHAAFLQGALSIHIAATGSGLVPSQARAMGCAISADLCTVTLFVSGLQATSLLADILGGGPVAAVFSHPITNRSVQFKAPCAQARRLTPGELDRVRQYRAAFINEVALEGFSREMVAGMLECPDDHLVALSFVPTAAFSQTPGPHAGEPLGQPS